jgi:hypothetical protein
VQVLLVQGRGPLIMCIALNGCRELTERWRDSWAWNALKWSISKMSPTKCKSFILVGIAESLTTVLSLFTHFKFANFDFQECWSFYICKFLLEYLKLASLCQGFKGSQLTMIKPIAACFDAYGGGSNTFVGLCGFNFWHWQVDTNFGLIIDVDQKLEEWHHFDPDA